MRYGNFVTKTFQKPLFSLMLKHLHLPFGRFWGFNAHLPASVMLLPPHRAEGTSFLRAVFFIHILGIVFPERELI
jgi:hypothetical protein